jgi:hypothetical protein
VAPCGQGADEQEDQYDDQDDSHAMLPLSFFPFQSLSLLKRFQDVLGIAHELFFYQTGALFLHKQPHTLCNNKPESFSIPPCLWPFLLIHHLSFYFLALGTFIS